MVALHAYVDFLEGLAMIHPPAEPEGAAARGPIELRAQRARELRLHHTWNRRRHEH